MKKKKKTSNYKLERERESYGKNLLGSSSRSFSLASVSAPPLELELAGKPPHFWHLATTRIWRHEGQDERDPSHVSMQFTWNPWPHWGKTRISSPVVNSVRQMAQSENLVAESSERVCLGRERRIFFFKPLLAAAGSGGGVWVEVAGRVVAEEEVNRRSQAQRATAMRPRTQIRAQRSAASITTKSESTVAGGAGGGPAADEFTAPRNRKVRVMWNMDKDQRRGFVRSWLECVICVRNVFNLYGNCNDLGFFFFLTF